MKKIFFVFSILWLFQSCLLNLNQSKYIDSARDYLLENFDDSFEYESIYEDRSWKNDDNQIFVKFKAAKLNNQIVTVKISETRQSPVSLNHSFSSNYLCLRFENQEIQYYKNIFEKYFAQCKIIIDNSDRLFHYNGVIYIIDEETGREYKRTDKNPDFEAYLNLINKCEFKNCITIAATQNQNEYLSCQDLLKASLMDLQDEEIKIDGNFYLVQSLEDDFSKNHSFAAKIDGYNHSGEHYRYKYMIID